jgi:two-component system KDP operon response regulator KdpE
MLTRPVVLVVDDERKMRSVLRVALEGQGYEVAEAATGEQAIRKLCASPPCAIILDLGLPDMDGVQVARAVRRDHELPIIVLSARGEEQQQILALDSGANDYVTKPFREGELMARLRASLRRGPRLREYVEITVGDLRLSATQRRVFVKDVEIELTPIEFRLLHLLACEAGRTVTHEQLLREVWGASGADEVPLLRVHMRSLRRKIEDDPSRPKRLLTTLGVGYRLE